MVELYNNIVCIEVKWLAGDRRNPHAGAVWTYYQYDHYRRTGKLNQVRGGGNGRKALVAFNSLPEDVRTRIVDLIGAQPHTLVQKHWFEDYLRPDFEAHIYYNKYMLPNGKALPAEKAKQYTTQAQFLNAIHTIKKEKKHQSRKVLMNNEPFDFWQRISRIVNDLDKKYKHSLPAKHGSLRNKYTKYRKTGYEALISGKYLLRNALKADEKVVRLILSMYVQDNLPFADKVHERYMDFIEGKIEIVDTDTGEIFSREDFTKNGEPLAISVSLVNNIINNPQYDDLKTKLRSDYGKYKLNASPYVRRRLPDYTLSKISVDDRTIRKGTDHEAWMYAAYEPTSQVFLAAVFNPGNPDNKIVQDMLRELYHQILKHKLYWPGEIEHEHHLMDSMGDMLDRLFAYRRVCNPSNSREKHIEHGFKLLKYGAEKEVFDNVGRWWGKGAYKNKDKYKETLRYEQIVAMEMEAIKLHNNSEHPLYKGKTRWQVLLENQNPDLSAPVKFRILKELGYRTDTSIQRSDFVRVQYEDYLIDRSRLHLLKPYRTDVSAYWLPEENGEIKEVYIYQDDEFICTGQKAERFNESLMEQTEEDKRIQLEQQKRLVKHLKQTNDQKEKLITGIEIIKKEKVQEMELVDAEIHISKPVKEDWKKYETNDNALIEEAAADEL